MKFALVSNVLPPSSSGQAVMLYHLLQGLSANHYCLLSIQNYAAISDHHSYSAKLPAKYYHLSPSFQITRGNRLGLWKWRLRLNLLLGIPGVIWRARQIAGIIRRENCGGVIACTANLIDLPASYLASRMTGVSFYPYLFDYYSEQWAESVTRFFVHRLESFLLKRATATIAPNEFLRDAIHNRYGVEATVIHNPCDLAAYEMASKDSMPATDSGEIKIVYTGAIYGAHFDAIRNLVMAIGLLDRPNLKLHLYTPVPANQLEAAGILGPVVYHPHLPVSAMPGIQRQADLLFLPLAFTSDFPEVIRTSSPGKIGEYLAARRPILVHAPPDSFVAWYFCYHKCGLVVDSPDPAQLARVIEQVLDDPELQQCLGKRAWERAQADFSITAAQSALAELMRVKCSPQ
jgi:glycosyltransferase involved in cell wall biosynthesis